MHGVVCQEGFHIRYLTIFTDVFTVMTTKTEICRLHGQLFGIVSNVRVVTGKTLLVSIEPLMGHGRFFYSTFLVLVTGIAKITFPFRFQTVLEVSAVRAVTVHACLLHRRVHELFLLEFFCFVRMAAETDVVPLCQKQLRELTLMNGVTGTAASNCNRAVDKFPPDQGLVMAEEAEVAARRTQLELVGGLVRVVTFYTLAPFHRGMDNFHLIRLLVAFFAEFSDITDRVKLVLADLLVAGSALCYCNRPVDKFVLPHAGMAFFRYT